MQNEGDTDRRGRFNLLEQARKTKNSTSQLSGPLNLRIRRRGGGPRFTGRHVGCSSRSERPVQGGSSDLSGEPEKAKPREAGLRANQEAGDGGDEPETQACGRALQNREDQEGACGGGGGGEGGQEEVKGKEKKDDHERRWSEEAEDRSGKQYAGGGALDLSPGLKHTLAQFTLSSQSSLGGPAAFSARGAPGILAPLPSPPVLGGGPLLVPCDSSTELTHSLLEGESITSFMVGGVKRLCLPQVLNSVLRQFSLQQINAVCDELYIYCSRCDGEQLHILKVLGILPFNAPSCGLITLTDAQRLCNALLRPGAALPPPLDPGGGGGGGKLREGETSFRVEHQCLGKCQGVFATHLYTHPDAPCIQCVQCHLLFAPQRFVMHSHRSPDKRTCHWGFDSARWARYLHLGRKHLGTPREAELRRLLEEVKEKFHCSQKKVPLDKKDGAEDHAVKKGSDVCSQNETHCDREPEQKAKSHPTHILKPPLSPDIKEESGLPASTLHRSCLLYMYDKVGARTPALGKEGAQMSVDILEALYKQHHSGNQRRRPSQDLGDTDVTSSPASGLHRTCGSAAGEGKPPSWLAAMEMAQGEDSCSVPLREEDKDRMVLEVLQMYYRQQEVLQSTLQKHRQLEMELETLRRGGTAIQGEPQKEAEAHTEHAEERDLEDSECTQKKECSEPAPKKKCTKTQKNREEHPGHAQKKRIEPAEDDTEERAEQDDIERHTEDGENKDKSDPDLRLENLKPQTCTCQLSMEQSQKAQHYASQLLELRRRLDQAEEDRAELQEELRRERDARRKLELVISQLRLQMPSQPPAPETEPHASPRQD
ncbi:hypothetical protein GJAV_G00084120 [Gymnothorax javanicus]|nr:hypothetical protein GJAV_G00084120 [Gymnothorax javanicus]